MILHAGDVLTIKKRWRIDVINSANRTALITDLDTKKSELYSWEMLQQLDSFLKFDVTKVKVEENE
jgi:hypothetical protein